MGVCREWRLRAVPRGVLAADDLALADVALPQPAAGEVRLRVLRLPMDPAIRMTLASRGGNYGAGVAVGSAVRGLVLGRVEASRSPALAVGDIVSGFGSWSEQIVGDAARFAPVSVRADLPLSIHTHVLGTSGLAALHGLADVGAVRSGDSVLVSAAAGGVGSLACQFARLLGASRVVGIAGGAEKCRIAVERYGCDACIDHRAAPDLEAALRAALPEGVDLGFENVGGAPLQAALALLRPGARIALCGMIAEYDAAEPAPGPANLWNLIVQRARIEGFRVAPLLADRPRVDALLERIEGWLRAGTLQYDIDERDGFEAVPQAFAALSNGGHRGRLVVRVAD
ncbi:MAG: NADP-dependent oxidoreductase [Burkholderiales bacterium]|nr:NADP-dependent oxidoreductase [Burkholderiales bacterium]